MTIKKYIRTTYYDDDDYRDIIKERLNSVGFYCLSVAPSGIEIYALEEELDIIEKIINWFKGGK